MRGGAVWNRSGMTEHLLVEQDPSKCLIGPELVRVFDACAKLAMKQSNIYSASSIAMIEMTCHILHLVLPLGNLHSFSILVDAGILIIMQ